jgi:hypothetical protein
VRGRTRRGNPLGGGFPHMTPERGSKRRMREAVVDRAWHSAPRVQRIWARETDGLQRATKAKQNRAAGYRVVDNNQRPGSQSFHNHGEPLFRGSSLTRPAASPLVSATGYRSIAVRVCSYKRHSTSNLGHGQRHWSTTGPLRWYTADMTERPRRPSYSVHGFEES